MQHMMQTRQLNAQIGPAPKPALPGHARRPRRCLLVSRAGGNGAEARVDVDKNREIAKMLLATQKNMLAINNSRVKVQEELAVANRRIADLEREVERLRVEARQNQAIREAQLPPPFSPDRPVSVAAAAPPAPAAPYAAPEQQQHVQQQQPYQQPQQQQQVLQQQAYQQQQQQPASAPAPPPVQQAPPPPAPPATITITYVSGWHNAFIHYCADNKSWTSVPGVRLVPSGNDHNSKSITIEGSKLEFVMNNGENDWDSPGRYTDKPKNYEISSPGSYRLKSGKLEKLS